jgi:tetratricopeptide (TPR) repeat protein
MKKITFTLLAVITFLPSVFAQNIDSLQKTQVEMQQLCAEADLYTNMADSLIQYKQQKTRVISIADAMKASDYVLKAIQINKKFNDTLAVRNNFDRLGETYIMQNKFSQAKWYILQSNHISRGTHDVRHIILGLMELADVKMTIKDYTLAKKDLDEAVVLTKYSHNIPAQIEVEKKLAALYDKSGNLSEAKATVTHYTLLAENLKKANEQQRLANLKKAKAQQILAIQKAKAQQLQAILKAKLQQLQAAQKAKTQQLLAMQKAKAKPKKSIVKQSLTVPGEQSTDVTTADTTISVLQNN